MSNGIIPNGKYGWKKSKGKKEEKVSYPICVHYYVLAAGKEWYFVTKIVLTYCEKNVLMIEKNF